MTVNKEPKIGDSFYLINHANSFIKCDFCNGTGEIIAKGKHSKKTIDCYECLGHGKIVNLDVTETFIEERKIKHIIKYLSNNKFRIFISDCDKDLSELKFDSFFRANFIYPINEVWLNYKEVKKEAKAYIDYVDKPSV